MLRPEDIINAKFTPVSKGTYSAEEVDAFLRSVAASYEESLGNNQELIKKISILADKIESYRNDEEAIKLALLDAHKMADNVSKAANDKAEALVADAEGKSKILLDGANRQAAQTIDEAREKAKEIVDNARTAVASLTEKAQVETDNAIADAKKKASEIIADAEEKGREIIGNSKQAYEFYSSELEKLHAETAKFKAAVEGICNSQLSLLSDIPAEFVAAAVPADVPVEAKAEVVAAEEPVAEEAVSTEEVENELNELYDDIAADESDAEYAVEEEQKAEDHDESAIALMAEINGLADNVFTAADNSVAVAQTDDFEDVDIIEAVEESDPVEDFNFAIEPENDVIADDDDDFFSMIEDVKFDGVADPDSFPASLDDLIPSVPVEAPAEENPLNIDEIVIEEKDDAAEEDEDDDFKGFRIDLDSVTDGNDDDEDITSLFDSLFDD